MNTSPPLANALRTILPAATSGTMAARQQIPVPIPLTTSPRKNIPIERSSKAAFGSWMSISHPGARGAARPTSSKSLQR
ncbi:MAG: hypothetical protein IPK15_15585 [Verrucomicrobia bacterium]|nr:hypothetical protein [Verrucomicrobiota bacterium]